MKPQIVGVGGTNGSGKDTIGEMLAERGWLFVTVSEYLREEARKQGLPIERKILRTIGDNWRRQYGHSILTEKAYQEFQNSKGKYKGLVVIPMRHPGEAEAVKKHGGKIVWVDADPKIRYQRVISRLRSDEDRKTYQEFVVEEQAEMRHSGDEATLNMSAVKAMADIFITNNGSDLEAFKAEAAHTLDL